MVYSYQPPFTAGCVGYELISLTNVYRGIQGEYDFLYVWFKEISILVSWKDFSRAWKPGHSHWDGVVHENNPVWITFIAFTSTMVTKLDCLIPSLQLHVPVNIGTIIKGEKQAYILPPIV